MFALVSRERFEARVPFDAGVIDIFKKMKTKQYGKFKVCVHVNTSYVCVCVYVCAIVEHKVVII